MMVPMAATPEVRDVPERGRFEVYVDDNRAGHMEYELRGDVLVANHTEVDPAYEGQGVGSALIRQVLQQVRDTGMTVVAHCPFVGAYIERHPEVQDLRSDGGGR